MIYMVQGPKWEYKPHLNQLKQRFTDLVNLQKEVPMEILYDTFDVPLHHKVLNQGSTLKKKGVCVLVA